MDLSQVTGLDLSIDLRRRQAGMAQQGLNRPQISAVGQQLRRETLTQGVRGGTGQAERAAQDLHLFAQDRSLQALTAGAVEEDDMAVMWAKLEEAGAILASATPALETVVNADTRRYRRPRPPH